MAEEKVKKTVKKASTKKEEVAAEAAPKKEKKVAAKKEAPVKEKKAKKAKEEKVVEEPKKSVTEASCFVRDIRITPRKVRLVVDLVRGKDVKVALGILARTNKLGAKPVAKAIASAAANAINNFNMDEDRLYVASIQVSDGLKIKRFIPRAKGSASGIIKRNANLRVSVKERK